MDASLPSGTSFDLALQDVETRFILNLPEAELSSIDRLFFQIEQAWWFYEDFYADTMPTLPHFRLLKSFALALFDHCPLLKPWHHMYDELFDEFHSYKGKVPVYGVILLNKDKTKFVLVRGWNGSVWSFPRGKVNHSESAIDCAVRETLEEAGFDCRTYLNEQNALPMYLNGQRTTMFVAVDVPDDVKFSPISRKEVSQCAWFDIDNLPKTFAVEPFISRLRRFIAREICPQSKPTRSCSAPKAYSPTYQSFTRRARSAPRKNSCPESQIDSLKELKKCEQNVSEILNFDSKSTEDFSRDSCKSECSALSYGSNVLQLSSQKSHSRIEFDKKNIETFGQESSLWSVEDMFSVNERLTGRSFMYDGSPDNFGCSQQANFHHNSSGNYSDLSAFSLFHHFQFNSVEIMSCF